jgi:hypothetical protein
MRQVGPCAGLVAAALVLFGASMAVGQTQTGNIVGVVEGSDGRPLPGVTVTLAGSGVMGTRTAVTEENGAFRFPSLIPPPPTTASPSSSRAFPRPDVKAYRCPQARPSR